MFESTTWVEADDFQAVFEFLDTCPHFENIKFHDGQNNKKPKSYPQDVKPGKKAKLPAIDQVFMYLSWLRNGFTTRMLSWLFDIPKSTVSRYLVTWTNLLYFSVGKIVIWSSKVQVSDTIPKHLKEPTHQLDALLTVHKYFAKDHLPVIPECYVFQP